MTPEEKAVVQAAIEAHAIGREPSVAQQSILRTAVHQLIFSCPECNAGGHTCPGDGEHIAHGETDCGRHWDPDYPGCAPETCGGSRLDPCSTVMKTQGVSHDGQQEELRWVPSTLGDCLAGDHIRIGTEETDVVSASRGMWHAKLRDYERADGSTGTAVTRWDHEECRLDLLANPGLKAYPPEYACEILCSPEREAKLTLQKAFPGTRVITVNCPYCTATSQDLPAHLADYHPGKTS